MSRSLELSQQSAIRLQHSVDALRDKVQEHETLLNGSFTEAHIDRLKDALEGYCEGLAIEDETARLILHFVVTGHIEDDDCAQNYNCPCSHPSQCTGFCVKPCEKGSAA